MLNDIIGTWAQLSFQDANSPLIEELIYLHDFINIILVFILSYVGLITIRILINVYINKHLLIAQIVEWVWTLIPAFILIQVAIPSLLLLYIIDESVDSSLTVKVIGHQWYWSYEYGDMGGS